MELFKVMFNSNNNDTPALLPKCHRIKTSLSSEVFEKKKVPKRYNKENRTSIFYLYTFQAGPTDKIY